MDDTIVAVIQAGGKGKRMSSYTEDKIPKPMLEIHGKNLIEWQLELLQRYKIKDVYIIVGHLGSAIEQYFGDGSRYGMSIHYIVETKALGSAGALYYLKDLVCSNIIFFYADIFVDMDIQRLLEFSVRNNALVTMVAHPNSHPYDSNLLVLDEDNRVLRILDKHLETDEFYDNIVNAGLFVLSPNVLKFIQKPVFTDMEQDILKPILKEERVYAYKTSEYIADAGTPERFLQICKDEKEGIVKNKNLSNKQKCIFIDRDGTLNVYKGLISEIEQIELEKNAAEAVKRINESSYLAILVTNQPVVAMGLCEIEDIHEFHRKIASLLGEKGAYLNEYVFCPHHPDQGFQNENVKYKIKCSCRKPQIGMIVRMAEKYNIDLKNSWMIGDTTRDMKTGMNAGLHTALVKTGEAGNDGKFDATHELEADNLYEAVKQILEK